MNSSNSHVNLFGAAPATADFVNATFFMLIPILITLLLCAGFLGMILYLRILRRLRVRHPATWEVLGAPTPFRSSLRTQAAMDRFLRGSGNHQVDDPVLARLTQWVIWTARFGILMFLLLLATALIVNVRAG